MTCLLIKRLSTKQKLLVEVDYSEGVVDPVHRILGDFLVSQIFLFCISPALFRFCFCAAQACAAPGDVI